MVVTRKFLACAKLRLSELNSVAASAINSLGAPAHVSQLCVNQFMTASAAREGATQATWKLVDQSAK
jgi:hypothetical protein